LENQLLPEQTTVENMVRSLFVPQKIQNPLTINQLRGFKVPEAGIEPARYCYHWILSPARLPIPPFGLVCKPGAKIMENSFEQSFSNNILSFSFL
jgi:hypothetical protein